MGPTPSRFRHRPIPICRPGVDVAAALGELSGFRKLASRTSSRCPLRVARREAGSETVGLAVEVCAGRSRARPETMSLFRGDVPLKGRRWRGGHVKSRPLNVATK
jgi:hypothetical protein